MKFLKHLLILCLFCLISIGAMAIPNNTIYYTSSDGNVVNPYSRNAFGGATIVSNKYSNGQGIIAFDRDVTSIGERAFYNCSTLKKIEIPNSVTSIGDGAFYGCFGLKGVNITDLDKWAEIEFGDDSANPLHYAHNLYLNGQLVTEAKLTTSKKIGSYAFYRYSGLTSVTIPNSVTSIGGFAFDGCSGLTSVTIPNSVTSIGDGAFKGCNNVKELIYAEGTKTVLSTGLTSITSVTIPNSVTSIGNSAFRDCSGLTSVPIPNSVTSIEDGAFSGCNYEV